MRANDSLTCEELIGFLSDYVEDTLESVVRRRFDAHLSACPDCVAYLESYRATVRLAAGTREPVPDDPERVPEDLVRAVLASRRR